MQNTNWTKSIFQPNYYDELNKMPDRQRGDGFLKIFEELERQEIKDLRILETGCMRPGGELSTDGQSTRLFYEFCKAHDGMLTSVDLDKSHVAHATKSVDSEHALVYQGDSVDFLWNKLYNIQPFYEADLIYLDSYDVDFREPWKSNLHHMKELVGAARYMKSGTIVAVDDCLFLANDTRIAPGVRHTMVGKGTFVESFMKDIGAEQLHNSYQKIWKIK